MCVFVCVCVCVCVCVIACLSVWFIESHGVLIMNWRLLCTLVLGWISVAFLGCNQICFSVPVSHFSVCGRDWCIRMDSQSKKSCTFLFKMWSPVKSPRLTFLSFFFSVSSWSNFNLLHPVLTHFPSSVWSPPTLWFHLLHNYIISDQKVERDLAHMYKTSTVVTVSKFFFCKRYWSAKGNGIVSYLRPHILNWPNIS